MFSSPSPGQIPPEGNLPSSATPATGFNLSQWAIKNGSFTRFLIVLLMVAGVGAYFGLGQKEDPDFTFRLMVVRAYWPGATAAQMAEQVADRLEQKLQETPYLDHLQSYTKPGEATILVFARESTPPKEIRNVWYQVRKKMSDVRQNLPVGVQGPFFNDEFGDTYIAMYAITADGFSPQELKDYADTARDRLLRVTGVEKIDRLGEQDPKVYVEFSQRKFAELGLTLPQVAQALGGYDSVRPGGSMQTPAFSVPARISGQYDTVASLADTTFATPAGGTFKLSDFARVYKGFQDPPVFKIRHQGREAMLLGVVMQNDADVLVVGKNLDGALKELHGQLPVGIELRQVTNQPVVVREAVGEFARSLVEAVVIVLAVSFLSLGFRTGLVVALSIPLVLAVTFIGMQWFGIALQKISLGALVIALGLLVDDAMISVEMMARKLEEGFGRLTAAGYAYTSTAFPMLTGTLVTAVGFLPVGLAESSAGEYTFSIFAVVGMALLVSWGVSVYFTPYIGYHLLPTHAEQQTADARRAAWAGRQGWLPGPLARVLARPRAHDDAHDLYDTPGYGRLRGFVNTCLVYRKTTLALTGVAFMLAIVGFAFIPQQFFPDSTRRELMVDMWLPEGSSFAATEAVVKRFEGDLAKDKDVADYVTYVGGGSPRFYLPLDQQLQHLNFGQAMVVAKDLPARERLKMRLQTMLDTTYPEIRAKIDRLPNGPPVGWPVQFRVTGPDPVVLRVIAEKLKAAVRLHPALREVHDNWHENAPSLNIKVDQDRLRALGITSAQVRDAGLVILSGATIGTFREGNRTIEIVARQPANERNGLAALKDAYMPTASGTSVPFAQFADAVPSFEPGVIWRRDRLPAITVQAMVVEGVQAPDVTKQIDSRLGPLRAQLPPGYAITVAGALEQSDIANQSIAAKVPIMLVLTLLILMVQLRRVDLTAMVLLTAPLGLIGAAGALLIFRVPFGFVAILGVIALAGMIMRNSVILIDQIEADRLAGVPAWEAVVEATVRRFRPIMLTAAAAVLALIPLSRSVFFGPMAVALMGGLVVATVLTIAFLPALYAAWLGVRREEHLPLLNSGMTSQAI